MEYLEFSGKKYVKVSSAARETGYTSDYIGQLCRARKIDAKLVGRTWYVAQDEIHNHRRSKGRSSHEKVRQNVKEQIRSSEQEVTVPVRISHTPLRHKRLLETQVSYHRDDSDLIPLANASDGAAHIEVQSRDREAQVSLNTGEHHVGIDQANTSQEPSTFAPTAKAEIKWNGTIVVEPLEKEVEEPLGNESGIAPLERHIRIHLGNERNIKPNLVISDVSNDPLETKKRFLERMNLAHALNTPAAHERVSQSRDDIGARSKGVNFGPVSAPVGGPQSTDVEASTEPSYSERAPMVRLLGFTTATVALVSVGFMLISAFVQTETEYRAPSGSGAQAVYFSSVRLSSPEKTFEVLSERMNEAMIVIPSLMWSE
jgi:hypothetical protein